MSRDTATERDDQRMVARTTDQTHVRTHERAQGDIQCEGGTENAAPLVALSALLNRTISARSNAPVRAITMQRAQQTHGNRAVQRFVQRTVSDAAVSIQRWPDALDPVGTDPMGLDSVGSWIRPRTRHPNQSQGTQDATGRASAMQGTGSGVAGLADAHDAGRVATTTRALNTAQAAQSRGHNSMLANIDNIDAFEAASHNVDQASSAVRSAEHALERVNSTPSRLGGQSNFSTAMNAVNYPLQYMANMAQGQSRGEAIAGAVPGAAFSNAIGGQLLRRAPSIGIADTAINLTNSVLQAGGAPAAVTNVTSMVASATPSSFGGAVVSNAGRGLYNAADALTTGNTEGLRRQASDIDHGRSGAPLQGLGQLAEIGVHAANGRNISDSMSRLGGREAARGDYGAATQMGVQLGDDWYNIMHGPGGLGAGLQEAGEGAALAGRDAVNATGRGLRAIGQDWSNMASRPGGLGASMSEAGEGVSLAAHDAWNATSRAATPIANAVSQEANSLAHDWSGIAQRPMASLREAGQGVAQAGRDAWNWMGSVF